jgi:citrate synthase
VASELQQGSSTADWLTAEEAAARLKVKRETVYAYVSRGRLASKRSDDGRGRVLDPADVERLASRARGTKRASAEDTESALTLIQDGELFYRGRAARELAQTRTFEEVADLLWGVDSTATPWEPSAAIIEIYRRVAGVLPTDALPVDMLRIVGACMAAFDPPEPASTPQLLVSTTKRVVATMITALPPRSQPHEVGPSMSPTAAILWSRLNARAPSDAELRMLNSAMIMLADHDLARSTIAIRTAARAGLDAGGLIRMGMDSGGGVVKGVASLAIEAFLHNLTSADAVEVALTRRLKQGEPVPGFGHPVYLDGDPRASQILELLREAAVDKQRLATVEEVIRMQLSRGLPQPNAGFALAAMTYVTGMVPGAGETIFVMSRTAGWMAHAIEVLEAGPLQRSNSTYIGWSPKADHGAE